MYILYFIYGIQASPEAESEDTSAAPHKLVACSLDTTNQRSENQQLFHSSLFKEILISCPRISKLYINSALLFSFTLLT